MSLTFKAFLYERTWHGDPVEIRRFTVDQDVSSSYAYLVEKVVQIFPSLRPSNFVLAWTDADGDIITISSDQELVEALDQFEGNIFRLFIKKKPAVATAQQSPEGASVEGGAAEGQDTPPAQQQKQEGGEETFHPGVECDGCKGPIYGTRYKCLVCCDYDLCSSCEGKGVHVDHNMLTITDPWSYHPWGAPFAGRCGFQRFGGGGRPFRGRGGCRGRGGGRGGGGGRHPYYAAGTPPFFAPWWQGFGRGGASCQGNPCGGGGGATAEEKRSGGESQEPMETEQKSAEEERRTFLHGVGQAVSNFLEPFGVKVDVDVVDKQPADAKEAPTDPPPTDSQDEGRDEKVLEEALAQLQSMGYQDEGGWLMELVKAKGGDVAKVLDALHPSIDEQD